jgi:hypothetical protein
MDAINPWLDPSEVRHLAEQLLRPVAPARLSSLDPGFDSSFVGFTETGNLHSTAAAPAPTSEKIPANRETESSTPPSQIQPLAAESMVPAKVVPPESPPKESPEPPPAPPSQTRFKERIHIFRDWLAKNFNARDIFILDREGKVIFDESGHGRLHFMARNLALASRGSSNIHVKIGPSSVLEVIPCETPYGRIVLGTLVPESLPSGHVQTIIEVLIQTASPW